MLSDSRPEHEALAVVPTEMNHDVACPPRQVGLALASGFHELSHSLRESDTWFRSPRPATSCSIESNRNDQLTLADLQANPTPGSGTWSLTLIDGAAGSTVALAPIQSIWIRDTITLSASGSVLSMSNTIVQVPEPGSAPARQASPAAACWWHGSPGDAGCRSGRRGTLDRINRLGVGAPRGLPRLRDSGISRPTEDAARAQSPLSSRKLSRSAMRQE